MNFSRKRNSAALHVRPLSLVALIDVVLFILIYFLMVGTIDAEEGTLSSVIKPAVVAAQAGNSKPLVVRVVIAGNVPAFVVGSRTITDANELSDILARAGSQRGVTIRVSNQVTVDAAAAAIQAARDAGCSAIGYAPDL